MLFVLDLQQAWSQKHHRVAVQKRRVRYLNGPKSYMTMILQLLHVFHVSNFREFILTCNPTRLQTVKKQRQQEKWKCCEGSLEDVNNIMYMTLKKKLIKIEASMFEVPDTISRQIACQIYGSAHLNKGCWTFSMSCKASISVSFPEAVLNLIKRRLSVSKCSILWMFPKIVGFHPKSSMLIGFSIINYPFWGTPIFWKHPYSSLFSDLTAFQAQHRAVLPCEALPTARPAIASLGRRDLNNPKLSMNMYYVI